VPRTDVFKGHAGGSRSCHSRLGLPHTSWTLRSGLTARARMATTKACTGSGHSIHSNLFICSFNEAPQRPLSAEQGVANALTKVCSWRFGGVSACLCMWPHVSSSWMLLLCFASPKAIDIPPLGGPLIDRGGLRPDLCSTHDAPAGPPPPHPVPRRYGGSGAGHP